MAQPYPGIPYLQVLRRPNGVWWRLVVVALASAIGLVVLQTAALLAVLGVGLLVDPDYEFAVDDGLDASEILAVNLGLMALIPLAFGLVRWVYGVRPRWLSSHRPGLRWPWLWLTVGVSAVVWVLFWLGGGLGALVTREEPLGIGIVAFLLVVLVTTPIQAAGEEYIFRGVILQALGATRMPTWLAIGLSAALFATAHLQFEPPLFADRFLLGVALAYLVVKTGGLEASIAIHAVKNVSVFIPAGLLGETEDALDPQNVTWLPFIVDVVLLAIAVPWVLYLYRRRRDRLDPSAGPEYPQGGQPWYGWQQPPPYGAAPPAGWQPPPQGWQQPPPGWQPPPQGWQPPPQGWQQPPPAGPAPYGHPPQQPPYGAAPQPAEPTHETPTEGGDHPREPGDSGTPPAPRP